MNGLYISLGIGMLFSPLAALVAFLITYNEYSHHFIEKSKIMKASLEAAALAFIVFFCIAIFSGLMLGYN